MKNVYLFLSCYAISCVAYELHRLVLYSRAGKGIPLFLKAIDMLLVIVGALGMFTIGLIDTHIEKVIVQRHYDQMKKLRAVAELQGYPDSYTEKRYDLDCRYYDHDGEFHIQLWKQHEYEKLGL